MKVFIDFSWLVYRSKFAFRNITVEKSGVIYNTGVILGVYNALATMYRYYKGNGEDIKLYLVVDGIPVEQDRHNAAYKANRDNDEVAQTFEISRKKLAQKFSCFPNTFLVYSGVMEADESIAFLCEAVGTDDNEKKVILTTDFDLRQLVDDSKNIFCSKKESSETGFIFEDEKHVFDFGCAHTTKVYPKSIALYKAICGDSSDNIFGIPRFPKALGKVLANEFCTIERLQEFLDKPLLRSRHERAYRILKDNFKLIYTNYQITKIDPTDIPTITKDEFPLDEEFFKYYGMEKVLTGIKNIKNL